MVCDGTCDVNMLRIDPDASPAMTAGEWWEDSDLSHTYTNKGWKVDTPDDTWYIDEVNHIIQSGRYFKPATLDQPETSNKEVERAKDKDVEENLVLKQLKKIQANISILGLIMASQEHRQALLEAMNRTKLPIDVTADQLVSLVTSGDVTPMISFTDKELPPEGANHNRPLYVTLESRKKWIPVVLVDTGSMINVCPVRIAYAIDLRPIDFTPMTQAVQAYDNTS